MIFNGCFAEERVEPGAEKWKNFTGTDEKKAKETHNENGFK